MKKIFYSALISLVMLNISNLLAQIPNGDLEGWTTVTSYEDPTLGWTTDNAYCLQIGGTAAVNKSTVFHDGQYSMSLSTCDGSFYDLPGIAACGNINVALGPPMVISYTGGFPCTVRYANFQGWYQYTGGQPTDSGQFIAILFKRNGAVRDTVAIAYHIHGAAASWTNFNDNFVYLQGNMTPDSAVVAFISSKIITAAPLGTTMLVDEIAFGGTVPLGVGINEVKPNSFSVSTSPNPANNSVQFNFSDNSAQMLNIYDILGKKVKSVEVSSAQLSVSVNEMNNGMYFYQVANKNNTILSTGKFSVKK